MSDWFYPYPTLYPGVLVNRYKRFFADITLDTGELITAHCPNTGPMTGICTLGSRVWVSRSNNPKRKLAYTWELIEVNDNEPTWAGVNTALPNRVIKSALEANLFPELGAYSQVRGEVCYGEKCRVDFLLQADNQALTYVEVKNTTWVQGAVALFPDTVTTRGQKHLLELTALLPTARSVMLYFINRGDCAYFAPGESADPVYARLLREAIALGLTVLPCRFDVTPTGLRYLGLAELKI
ncbi:DNA/RNA nuclease SfsA [Oculatella sp. LEGE 06141]|uniref:DNA/RNA nuclease SfsA n=1 Tax=Oculatella sp. LEGE 06141 TaxID=1828648 RepID=UPI00187E5201|nr:DNA/RNA nuclease SfsA [Oculatella sp. LEGE 06141]MBE9178818.1 DNA/RNA nuclease SfsA [Oculatella sp. LEGE 06141]